jgi:hypothetical protein
MKTYIITEKDIDRLRCNLDSGGDEVYWYISQLDNWEETLEEAGDIYFCECEEKYLDYMCPCKMRN